MEARNMTQKRKLQMMEIPKVKTIKQYDNFYNGNTIIAPSRRVAIPNTKINRKKQGIKKTKAYGNIQVKYGRKVKGANMKKVGTAFFMICILLVLMIFQMWLSYGVSKSGDEKRKLDENLKELKLEVEGLENKYISNFDLKQVENMSRDMGFVPNDNIEYVKVNSK